MSVGAKQAKLSIYARRTLGGN